MRDQAGRLRAGAGCGRAGAGCMRTGAGRVRAGAAGLLALGHGRMYIARGVTSSDMGHERGSTSGRLNRGLLTATRVWLPIAIAVAGAVLIGLGGGHYSKLTDPGSLESAAGVSLLIVALIVWMINWLFRLSLRSNADRDREERAREYFDRTGRWPDEE